MRLYAKNDIEGVGAPCDARKLLMRRVKTLPVRRSRVGANNLRICGGEPAERRRSVGAVVYGCAQHHVEQVLPDPIAESSAVRQRRKRECGLLQSNAGVFLHARDASARAVRRRCQTQDVRVHSNKSGAISSPAKFPRGENQT